MCALVLKAAVPFLAAVAAHAQARFVPEVCSIYGVALRPAAVGAPKEPQDGGTAGHQGECALALLFGAAAPQPAAVEVPPLHGRLPTVVSGSTFTGVLDRSAAWVARLKHGPPDS